MTNKQNTSVTLNSAHREADLLEIADSQELLTTYALGDELLGDLTVAFGSEYNREAAQDLVKQWQTGDFDSFPEIEIRSSDTINGANGAYSADTNKIYIAEEYLLAHPDDRNAIASLLIQELGHYIKKLFPNSRDAELNNLSLFVGDANANDSDGFAESSSSNQNNLSLTNKDFIEIEASVLSIN